MTRTDLDQPAPLTLAELEDYRRSIDNLDSALIALLAERFRLTEKVGLAKAASGLPPHDAERERKQLEHLRGRADAHALDPDVAADLMSRIFHHVKERHEVLRCRR